MNVLEQKLTSIEEKLGGSEQAPENGDKLGWHLDYIESLIGGSGGDIELKTLNNESLKGEGNIEILGLPTIQEGDAGKAVKVKEDETGYELDTISGGHTLWMHQVVGTINSKGYYANFISPESNKIKDLPTSSHIYTTGLITVSETASSSGFKCLMFQIELRSGRFSLTDLDGNSYSFTYTNDNVYAIDTW